ncbi:MAG: carbohydrate ABC transporter permease [Chloroflexi bacterium]|nr:carbohydrate ABC transporter permease [Chloroflexota bacterium]
MPFLWMITTSLKPPGKLYEPPLFFPTYFAWENYAKAWHFAPFPRFFLNSAIMAIGITLAQTLFSAMAGYAFARLKFPGRNALFYLVIGTMMIPPAITLIPSFLIVKRLGWIDTYQALIVPRAVSAFAIFLFRQFFLSLPHELEEAALIDGANRFIILFRIVLPLSTPVIATNAIFSFLFAWNDFLWPLVVTNSNKMRTIQVGLAMFQGQYGIFWTLLMAATTIATLPAILAFLLAQRRFIEGITTTGLRG